MDLHGDDFYTDYSARLGRENTGQNARTLLLHRGHGDFVIEASDDANMYLSTRGTARLHIGVDGNIRPATDNVAYIGTVDARWSNVCAGSGVIQTSDERVKKW